ncbi:phosphoglycerate mutase [Bacillus cereus group sp. N14]|uniref:phosphoglycerate mutase n=1 Tax=Bacillus cereus group sp. N14 TaxID=2794587 RepID=UPI0018F67632|nr:phosphoglycerate mutase [Bacillus cereus group sp. N14]MBJ8081987.1 phosphoglycerate mutase [Bacillus cereus group sp. N14]
MKWIIAFIGMIIWGYINGFFNSDKTANPWITDDERETKIKQKAIIASWSGVFMFCIINLLNKWLGLGTSNTSPYLPSSVATILKENVELQVLLILFITYGIFYVYYRRKLSA